MLEHEIRRRVRNQIIEAIAEDLNGGERLMKEVWEGLSNSTEEVIAKDEIRRIRELIVENAC